MEQCNTQCQGYDRRVHYLQRNSVVTVTLLAHCREWILARLATVTAGSGDALLLLQGIRSLLRNVLCRQWTWDGLLHRGL